MRTVFSYYSPLGRIAVEADAVGLTRVDFEDCLDALPIENIESPVLLATVAWLDAYFSGERPDGKPLLHLTGSPFSLMVLERLTRIPYGEVVTYGALARELSGSLGKARMSAQAIGGAVGRNPIAILVPCHRVVGAGGNLTGFGGGLDKKVALLTLEGLDMRRFHPPKQTPDRISARTVWTDDGAFKN